MPNAGFREAIDRAVQQSGITRPVTALYVSAGTDTAPFMFLHDGFRRHRGAWGPPTPDLFIYVDMLLPTPGGGNRLTYRERKRDNALVVETTALQPLEVEGHHANLLEVAFHSDIADEERSYTVLRIQALNETVLDLCRQADWSPDIYIAVCDGDAFGGNYRCENSLHPELSPFLTFTHPPRWWVTDHFSPRNDGRSFESGDFFPVPDGFPHNIRKVALLSSDWGHPWPPLHGATSFEVTPR